MARKGVKMQVTNFQLDAETHKALRIAAIEAGVSMGEALRRAVEVWLKGQKKTGKEVKK
jgi:hypothetical protein